MRQPLTRPPRGSALIEALVALVIFAIGILGVVSALGSQTRASLDARYRSEAAAAVDEYVARIQTASPLTRVAAHATGGAAFDDWLTNRLRAPGTGLPGADATVTFGVIGGDSRTVAIEVRWTPPSEAARNAAGDLTAQTPTHRFRTVAAITR